MLVVSGLLVSFELVVWRLMFRFLLITISCLGEVDFSGRLQSSYMIFAVIDFEELVQIIDAHGWLGCGGM